METEIENIRYRFDENNRTAILLSCDKNIQTEVNIPAQITIGAIIAPNFTPNLNHSLFNGVKSFDLVIAKNKNMNEIRIKKILISPPLFAVQKPKTKKTIKKTTPKFRLELILIFDFILIVYFLYWRALKDSNLRPSV